jgi:para-nitrobenzyl esterase
MKRIECFRAAASLVAAFASAAVIPEQVRIETGLIAGTVSTSQPTVRVFKGIPFAAPPLGENRWRAPQPAGKWEGVRQADAFGAPCIAGAPTQGRGGGRGNAGAAGQASQAAPPAQVAPAREPARSEDCLYANVWTSAQ